MKLRNLLLGVSMAAALLAGCKDDGRLSGEPSLTLSPAELAFEESAAATQTITLSTTREWAVKGTLPEWMDINPVSGEAAPEGITVEVTVTENQGTDRSASVDFTIGTITRTLAVSQKGEGGAAEDLIVYHNDFDVEAAVNNSGWPFLDKTEVWKNAKGTGISSVEYAFSGMSVRNGKGVANSSADGGASLYNGSGVNNVFFAKENYFQVRNITLDASAKNYVLSFGGVRSVFGASAGDGQSVFDVNQFSAYVSNDGAKWVKLAYTFASGAAPDNKWDKLTSVFTLPDNTASLYLYFTTTEASTYRIDDLDLSVSPTSGTAIDFSAGVELNGGTSGGDEPVGTPEGDGTEASPYNVAAALAATKAQAAGDLSEDVYIKGIISSIKEIDTGDYGNATYYISDDGKTAGQFMVFRGYYFNGEKFTSSDQIKVGDNVLICGKLINYMGNTPEVNQGSKIITLNGASEDNAKRLSVSPTSLNVSADAESATFKVNGNVSWTASVTEGSDFVEILYGESGTGAGDVVLQLTKNESEESARTAKITVSTTEDAAVKSYVVTLTQAKKAGANSKTVTISTTSACDWKSDSHATYGEGRKFTSDGFNVAFYKYKSSTANADGQLQNNHIRVYKNNALVINSDDNKVIKSVVVTCAYKDKCFDLTVLTDNNAIAKADTDAATITYTGNGITSFEAEAAAGQCRISSIEIIYE